MHLPTTILCTIVLALTVAACGGGGGGPAAPPPAEAPSPYPTGNWFGLASGGERVVLQVGEDGSLLFVTAPGALRNTRGDLLVDQRLAPARGFELLLHTGERGTAIYTEGPDPGDRNLAIVLQHDDATHVVLSPAGPGAADQVPAFEEQDLRGFTWRGDVAPFRSDAQPQAGAEVAAVLVDAAGRAWGNLGPDNLFIPAAGEELIHLRQNRWWIEVVDGPTGDPRLVYFSMLPSKRAVLVISFTVTQAQNGVAYKHIRMGVLERSAD